MNSTIPSLFLAQSYKDTWEDYVRSLQRSDVACWDYVILTASNEHQAEIFKMQIDERMAAGFLPKGTKFAVVPDRDNVRIGSGGATLEVIKYIAEEAETSTFDGLRVLVIHSGGDSKRVPQYSAIGKLFSPVPNVLDNGRAATLFDELMIAMSSVPGRIREGMVLMSGDVLPLFNPLQIDYSGEGAAAISFKEDVDTGKDHGVFLRGADGNVKRFMHKMSIEALTECGAVNERGCVDIDTGAVIFSAKMVESLYSLIAADGVLDYAKYDKYVNNKVRLSLYGDFLYPLATDSTLEAFYKEKPEGSMCPELLEARSKVWEVLHPYRMKLLRLAPARFIHFGTTHEILKLVTDGISEYEDLGWSSNADSVFSEEGNIAGYLSALSEGAKCGNNCYFEVSYVHSNAVIGDNVVLSYIDIHNVTVPSNVVMHGLKQRDGRFVARIYGITDNPKGGIDSPILGSTLGKFMSAYGISEDELFDDDADRSIWNAKLYPACSTISEAVDAALNLYEMFAACGDECKERVAVWRDSERQSLASGFACADPEAVIAWNKRMRELVRISRLEEMIIEGWPASEAVGMLGVTGLTPIQKEWLEQKLDETESEGQSDGAGSNLKHFGRRMRLNYYIGKALGGAEGEKYISECFKTISQTILTETLNGLQYNKDCHIVYDKHVVKLPLRVNWGGGWSDTPPYCNEKGGTVLNAAILLQGEMPVEVSLERISERKIVFDSRDMDVHGEFAEIEPLQRTGDPYDSFALQKAALLACGIIPKEGGSLEEILNRIGGGFIMRSEVTGVPKGSGLGTSSILSAACVKAIFEFMGIEHTEDDLYSHVLCMEQIMSTGGGWQDQVGGVTPGIKYIKSLPGLVQDISVEHLNIPEGAKRELNERFALIYTGQRRLARNLLRDVVGRYVGNEKDSLYALNEIQRNASLMKFELERGNIDAFGTLMNEHWELSKLVDAGSTNTLIDHIFNSVDDLLSGKMICGAGGGGFLQVLLKRGVTTEMVHDRLKEVFEDNAVDIWDCELI